MLADRTDFLQFRREYTVTPQNPSIEVVIEFQEPPGLFGVRRSEIPKNTGLRAIDSISTAQPDEMRFAIRHGSNVRLNAVLLLDQGAHVWRYSGAQHDGGVYHLVAEIDAKVLHEMEERCKTASETELIPEVPGCADCMWKNDAVCDVRGAGPAVLAADGALRSRRRNPAADVLLKWLLGVNRDAPVIEASD